MRRPERRQQAGGGRRELQLSVETSCMMSHVSNRQAHKHSCHKHALHHTFQWCCGLTPQEETMKQTCGHERTGSISLFNTVVINLNTGANTSHVNTDSWECLKQKWNGMNRAWMVGNSYWWHKMVLSPNNSQPVWCLQPPHKNRHDGFVYIHQT